MRFDGYLKLKGLGNRTIEQYNFFYSLYNKEHGQKLSQDSINNFILEHNYPLTRFFLKHLLEFKGIDKIKVPKMTGRKKQKILRYLNPNDIYKMADYFGEGEGLRNNLMMRLGFEGGLRVSELINIKPSDIDLKEKRIRIIGKGKKGGIIKFNEKTKQLLSIYLKEIEGNNLLFDITRQRFFKIIQQIGEKVLNKQKINPHILRHSCATYLLDKGMDLKYIQDYLRHSNLNTVAIYTHTNKEKMFRTWEDIMEN